ncbi:MAG: heavy metal-binding domain-containing protein [Mesorhizobium sp.]|nr:heavy metal-binding domain-containing protein [Mesorhizobium sp.]
MSAVFVATGSVCTPYIVLDTILAVGGSGEGFFSGPDASTAFNDAKNQLRAQAEGIGGDAVINCDFEVRNYSGGINIIAFGTVVKFFEPEVQD